MRNKLIIILSFFLIFQSYGSMAQKDITFGLSVNQGFSLLSNKEQVVSDQFAGDITPPSRSYPKGLWRSGSIAFDSYWLDERLVASIGLNSFLYKYVADSVLPSLSNNPVYGQKTYSTSVVSPFIRLGYRFKLSEHLVYQPSLSFGISEIFNRSKSRGTAYDPSEQDAWEHEDFWDFWVLWSLEFEKKSFMFEFGNHLVYDVNRWSFSGGLTYYFYRNLPIEGYHGLHLNVGCSVRFGNLNKN